MFTEIRTPVVFNMQYSVCNIPYAILHIAYSDFKVNCDILSKKLIDRGYKKTEICDSTSKTFDRNREDVLTQNSEHKYRIPLTLT